MRETDFIQQNEAKWREFEQVLEGKYHHPSQMSELFIQVTDDLSYARTFYPNRSVRVYLNGLAQKVFSNIYKNKSSRRSRFVKFWIDDLPRLLYEARKELLLSLLVFALAVAIGMLSCAKDPEFLRVILGDSYVEMTKANIRSGDPMAVYKQRGEFNMFLGITLHNLMVAFQTFIMGIFYAVGTLGSLLYNGVMLGAFQYFFIAEGLFWESFLAVWMHGAFELSSIVIAGAAGITMGKGLAFPGTLSRLRSFQLAARRGISIMVGVVPLFVIAGFTESYLTRHTEVPDFLRGVYILLCLGIVVFYFAIYPARKAKRGFFSEDKTKLATDLERDIDLSLVKTTGELFTDAFLFYRKKIKPIAWAALAGATIYCTGAFLTAGVQPTELFSYPGGLFGTFSVLPFLFVNDNNLWLFPLITLAMAGVAFVIQVMIAKEDQGVEPVPLANRHGWQWGFLFIRTFAVIALMNLAILTMDWYTFLLIVFTFPVLFLWMQAMLIEQIGYLAGLLQAIRLSARVYGQMTGLFLTMLLTGTLLFMVLDTGLLYLLLDVLTMNLPFSPENGEVFFSVLITFLTVFVLLLIFALWVAGGSLQYYSNLEILEAKYLRERIRQIGIQRQIKGLERE